MTLLHADICEHSERQKSKMADGRRCWVMGMMGFAIQMATGVLFSMHPIASRGPRECNWEVLQDVMSGGIYNWACAKKM